MHKLLARQLKQCGMAPEALPPEWALLARVVDQAYVQADADRHLLEHAFELTSQELLQKNQDLHRDVTERERLETRWREQAQALEQNNLELARRERIMRSLLEDLQAVRQRLEDQKQALETTNAQLAESHAALKSAQLQLIQAEKMESVGRLSAGVAHEVKNPLAILMMGVEYLTSQWHGDGDVATVLQDMLSAAKRADAVVHGLLDFSADKTLQWTVLGIPAVLEHALLLVKHELDKAHITVVQACGQDLPAVRVDRMKMEQVFINLFMNAIHAMPQGGTLTVTAALRPMTMVAHAAGSRTTDRFQTGETVLAVEVDDTGTGIAVEHLPKIFDPFFTTKPTGQGTGLGLTVIKKIVELHGGTLEIANRPEGGVRATVLLKLPNSINASVPSTASPQADQRS